MDGFDQELLLSLDRNLLQVFLISHKRSDPLVILRYLSVPY